MEIE
jgi:hypothetical protein